MQWTQFLFSINFCVAKRLSGEIACVKGQQFRLAARDVVINPVLFDERPFYNFRQILISRC